MCYSCSASLHQLTQGHKLEPHQYGIPTKLSLLKCYVHEKIGMCKLKKSSRSKQKIFMVKTELACSKQNCRGQGELSWSNRIVMVKQNCHGQTELSWSNRIAMVKQNCHGQTELPWSELPWSNRIAMVKQNCHSQTESSWSKIEVITDSKLTTPK